MPWTRHNPELNSLTGSSAEGRARRTWTQQRYGCSLDGMGVQDAQEVVACLGRAAEIAESRFQTRPSRPIATPSQDATPPITERKGWDNRSRDYPCFLEEEEPWNR
jgi:hypothetical protein